MIVHEIKLNIPAPTHRLLTRDGFALCGFRAVRTRVAGGIPALWFHTTGYGTSMAINWTDRRFAFTAPPAPPGTPFEPKTLTAVQLGEMVDVEDGTASILRGGPKHAVSIANATAQAVTCGLAQWQSVTGTVTPFCAFPLAPHTIDIIAPLEQVLLMFVTQPSGSPTAIAKAYSPGLLVEVGGGRPVSLRYDVGAGWSVEGAAYSTVVPPDIDLAALLIDTAPLPFTRESEQGR